MTYADPTVDNPYPASERVTPGLMRNPKLSTSTTAAYKLLPRNVKSAQIYCTTPHWVRIDLVAADPESARDLGTTSKENVIYVPAGSFTLAQEEGEFNCISAKTVTGTDTLYIYPGGARGLNSLVAEDLLA